MTIDDYISERNKVYLRVQAAGKEAADRCWTELGVANRHIERVLTGALHLRVVEREIAACLRRVEKLFP